MIDTVAAILGKLKHVATPEVVARGVQVEWGRVEGQWLSRVMKGYDTDIIHICNPVAMLEVMNADMPVHVKGSVISKLTGYERGGQCENCKEKR